MWESGPALQMNEMEEVSRCGLITHAMKATGEMTRPMGRES